MSSADSEPTCAICQEPHIAPPLRLKSNEALVEGNYVLLGKYTITGRIGDDSGMGTVFQATHKQIGRIVAIKRMNPEFSACPLMVEKFANEARIVAEIHHPNICDVLDAGFDRSLGHYIVMEWLAGGSLRSLIKLLGRVPVRSAVRLVRQLLEGVEATHRAHVVHRDIKPENAFVATRQPWTRELDLAAATIKLLDFGIARVARSPGAMTMQGPMTLFYGAPEQALRPMSVGPPADLWAVGLVLHELVTGELPFQDSRPGTAPWQVVLANEQRPGDAVPLTPIHHRVPGTPTELTAILERCLAFDPARRWPSAAEFAHALLRLETTDPHAATLTGRKPDAPTPQQPVMFVPDATSAPSIAELADRIRPQQPPPPQQQLPTKPHPRPRLPVILLAITGFSIAWIFVSLAIPTPPVHEPISTLPAPPPITSTPTISPSQTQATIPADPPIEPQIVDLPPSDATPRKRSRRPTNRPPGEAQTPAALPRFAEAHARQQIDLKSRTAADTCFRKHPFLDVFEYTVTLAVDPEGRTTATGTVTSPLRRCLLAIFSPEFTLDPTQDGGNLTYTFHSAG